jgi:hypothetical protein
MSSHKLSTPICPEKSQALSFVPSLSSFGHLDLKTEVQRRKSDLSIKKEIYSLLSLYWIFAIVYHKDF